MNHQDERFVMLEASLSAALERIERLEAAETIRRCLLSISRGLDRLDLELMRAAFHPEAHIDYGGLYRGPVEGFLESTMQFQATQSDTHHMIGNVLIELDGRAATAESYEVARHRSGPAGEVIDLVLAGRLLDRFENRDGRWAIVTRRKVLDWGASFAFEHRWLDGAPLPTGTRDRHDLSYETLRDQSESSRR